MKLNEDIVCYIMLYASGVIGAALCAVGFVVLGYYIIGGMF